MYLPSHFRQDDVGALHAAIEAAALATLVSQTAAGPVASHIPMLLAKGPAPHGVLRGHLARANSQWREHAAGTDALAIFLGPDAYVSPAWYPSKAQSGGKVVPTWNYVAVHATGPLRFFTGADELLALVEALTRRHEGKRAQPWSVSDAPADYVQKMLQGIVGFELTIARLEGKWKLGQNRTREDRGGVVSGLRREGGNEAIAQLMSAVSSTDKDE